EDLYYRLAVVQMLLPPLRARRDDIPMLANHFHRRFAGEGAELPSEFMTKLSARSWPGNVRELRNFIERSISLGLAGPAAPRASPPRPNPSSRPPPRPRPPTARVEEAPSRHYPPMPAALRREELPRPAGPHRARIHRARRSPRIRTASPASRRPWRARSPAR